MNDDVAKILDQALESVLQGKSLPAEWVDRYPQYGEELKALLDMGTSIRALSLPEPSLEFTTQSRLRLLRYVSLKQAAAQPAVRKPVRRKQAKRVAPMFRRTALSFAMVVTLLVALMSTGTVYASNNTIPGDTLYPVKIAVEDIRLAVSSNEQDASLYIQFSERRVQEIELLMEQGRVNEIPVATARYDMLVEKMIEVLPQISVGVISPEEQNVMRETVANNTAVLNRVLGKVPEQAKPAIQHAIESSSKEQEELNDALPPPSKFNPNNSEIQGQPTTRPTKTPKPSSTPKPNVGSKGTDATNTNAPPGGTVLQPTMEKPTRQP